MVSPGADLFLAVKISSPRSIPSANILKVISIIRNRNNCFVSSKPLEDEMSARMRTRTPILT